MGKRSNFKRRERDYYPTPFDAVRPLVPHLPPHANWIEPMAGAGHLYTSLMLLWPGGRCVGCYDIEPQAGFVWQRDVWEIREHPELFITNPMFPLPGQRGEPTISVIQLLASMAPTWLLLPSDFAFNDYFRKVASFCQKIVAIGRVSWMNNGKGGQENYAWYLFCSERQPPTEFVGRTG